MKTFTFHLSFQMLAKSLQSGKEGEKNGGEDETYLICEFAAPLK